MWGCQELLGDVPESSCSPAGLIPESVEAAILTAVAASPTVPSAASMSRTLCSNRVCLIVDDFIGTQRADRVQILCEAVPVTCTPPPGQLHREAADTACHAVDPYGAGQPSGRARGARLSPCGTAPRVALRHERGELLLS